jgi:DNA mismatch repair protein MutL
MSSEPHIRVLSDHVANKIAAGEVVERPASALKELIENSLDAGATQLEIEIVAGGRALVRVGDNGGGMNRDDALLSVERYATSKIRDVDDIECIATLGFRGEALAAISAASRFRLCTRRAGDLAGTEIVMSGGKIQDVRDAGCPPGTNVEVRNLFFNVPARRKFLRSEATELAHIRQVFLMYALAHPAVGMTLTIDGRATNILPGGGGLEDRLRELMPADLQAPLRRVDYSAGGVSVAGFVGLPASSRADRSEQYVFINGRPASAPILGSAIREGYHSLLPRERYPIVFLFIKLDPAQVDVNVHPTKKEVRFRDPVLVRDTTIEAIRRALSAEHQAARPEAQHGQPSAGTPPPTLAATPMITSLFKTDLSAPSRAFPYPRPAALTRDGLPAASAGGTDAAKSAPAGSPPAAPPAPGMHPSPATGAVHGSPWARCRILGQVGGLYVVLETEDGLVLMDPHAAHERVLYERYLAEVTRGRVESQGLLIAETVELPPAAAHRVRRHLDLLKALGFGIAEFGGDTFVVDALPACFAEIAPKMLLPDMASALEDTAAKDGGRRLLEERIAQSACKAAVKAHQVLTDAEIEALVVQLAAVEMPYTCPHGRPTLIHQSFQELAKKFGRI